MWAKLGHFRPGFILWAKCVFENIVLSKRIIKIGVSSLFVFEKKVVSKIFRGYYLGQVGHVYVATNLAQMRTPTWPR